MLTTQFHIPNHFTLNIGIMYTERVRFCTGPEVNFDFFTSHHDWGIFDGGATAIFCGNSMENTAFQGGKSWH